MKLANLSSLFINIRRYSMTYFFVVGAATLSIEQHTLFDKPLKNNKS
jgi:hypothetical protein